MLRMIKPPVRPTRLNGSVAPTCPIVRSQPVPGQPATRPGAIPPAVDLPSAIRAINQLININNYFEPVPLPNWVEDSRTTQVVRVYNPNDKSQWVDVERINNLTFVDQDTGGVWQWSY